MESATPPEAVGLVEAHSFAGHWSQGGTGLYSGVQPVGGQQEQLCPDKAEVHLQECNNSSDFSSVDLQKIHCSFLLY